MGKIVNDRDSLKAIIEDHRERGHKVVFTNGCFDIIHAGHVRYLKEAANLGTVLVVAINSDESVSAIKPGRPIVPEAQRAEVVAALQMVDYVTMFDEPTPYELLKAIRPDVLVKGGDWKPEDIIGSDLVSETHSLPYFRGASTTSIIEKIRNSEAGA